MFAVQFKLAKIKLAYVIVLLNNLAFHETCCFIRKFLQAFGSTHSRSINYMNCSRSFIERVSIVEDARVLCAHWRQVPASRGSSF